MMRLLLFLPLLLLAPAAKALTQLPQPTGLAYAPARHHAGFFQKIAGRMAARRIKHLLATAAPAAGDSITPDGHIWLLRGDKVAACDLSVDSTSVRYRPCDQPTYPLFVLDKREVVQVTNAAGKVLFRQKKVRYPPTSYPLGSESWVSRLALALSVFAILGILMYGISIMMALIALVALVTGIIAFNRSQTRRGSIRERSYALIGLLLGIIAVFGTVLAKAAN